MDVGIRMLSGKYFKTLTLDGINYEKALSLYHGTKIRVRLGCILKINWDFISVNIFKMNVVILW